jgi:hypothetical protein
MWKLALWAAKKSYLPPESPIVPPLKDEDNGTLINIYENKVRLLKKRFFSLEPSINLSDIINNIYSYKIIKYPRITTE